VRNLVSKFAFKFNVLCRYTTGIGVDTIHYLNDGLWKTDKFEL
jgi:predicted ribosome-associated RNA-binding protein Tma20